jgi:hypothetical protein
VRTFHTAGVDGAGLRRKGSPDVDAVFQPYGIVLDEASAVVDEVGLPVKAQASVHLGDLQGAVARAAPRRSYLGGTEFAIILDISDKDLDKREPCASILRRLAASVDIVNHNCY